MTSGKFVAKFVGKLALLEELQEDFSKVVITSHGAFRQNFAAFWLELQDFSYEL